MGGNRNRSDVRDLRAKLTNRRRNRSPRSESRFRKVSRRSRSRSPVRRPSVDERKSYLKFLTERDKRTELQPEESVGEREKHKKKKKKHKKEKHREKRKDKERRSKDKETNAEESRSRKRDGAKIEEEQNGENEIVDMADTPQTRETETSVNETLPELENGSKSTKLDDSDLESNFDDFDETKADSLSSSSLSLSSIDDLEKVHFYKTFFLYHLSKIRLCSRSP
jgi:outer membrane biosynthesis protein TonB